MTSLFNIIAIIALMVLLVIAIYKYINYYNLKEKKFSVMICWDGSNIENEKMLVSKWRVKNNLLTLIKKNFTSTIVLDKTSYVTIVDNHNVVVFTYGASVKKEILK